MRRVSGWLGLAVLCLGSMAWAAADGERLIAAAKNNDIGAVRLLLREKVDVHAAEADGSTALHWAVQRDNLEMFNLLMDAGANPSAVTRYKVTPLYLAAANGNAAIIERLLKAGVDANSSSHEGQTALMTASLNGKTDALRVLLAKGADIETKDPLKGQSALMWAAGAGNAAAVKLLIDSHADVQAKSQGGFTPILFAVLNERLAAAKVLLEHGAKANDATRDGTSALNMAVVNAYYDIASLLLDFGADPNATDARGSALHTLAWLRKPGASGNAAFGRVLGGPPVPTGQVTSLELAKKLLDRGAKPNTRAFLGERRFNKVGGFSTNPPNIDLGRHIVTFDGATPFWLAANHGDVDYMRLLLSAGADPLIPSKFGVTPLMVAAGLNYWEGETPGPFTGTSEEERLEAVKLALQGGNDINARADFGDFPIVGDAKYTLYYYPLNIDALADLGVGDPRWDGSTALHGAVVSGQPSIAQFLIDQGAKVDAVNDIGATPLMLAQGFFLANAEKVYPAVEEVIVKALKAQGLAVPQRLPVPRPIGEDSIVQ